ncbi:MAG: S41 family peptidase [Cyclobacteriaceae bacterium]|nr:S41 family peptidase [Cyclobacteriaceae bacterium]
MTENSSKQVLLPIWLALAIGTGIFIGAQFVNAPIVSKRAGGSSEKLREVLLSIENNYVDSVNADEIVDDGIKGMLEELDPHTSYIPRKEVNAVNAQLNGHYDGIGIEFDIISDSIVVVKPSPGGPSEKAGIQIGDRIIEVNGEQVAGIDISNKGVTDRLLGSRGSEVSLVLYRPIENKKIEVELQRGSIQSPTVDAYYMIDEKTGYIKLGRFGSDSYNEVANALQELKEQGMNQLVFDLQDNPGGYLGAAEKIADEFIQDGRIIVSQKGNNGKYDDEFRASGDGLFESQPVIVLVNEYSASASEIVAGAMQDNDRALIVGRRSFGKGLVQLPITLNDGSELRLTIARYYTPSGRCIQKSYKDGMVKYAHDINVRYDNGEFFHADSIQFADSLKYTTVGGRTVYGGGGIMPDYFVPLDTTQTTTYYNLLLSKHVLREFTISYVVEHKEELQKQTFDDFVSTFGWDAKMLGKLKQTGERLSVPFDQSEYERSDELIKTYSEAEIARLVWGGNAFYELINPETNEALESSLKLFDKARKLEGIK